MNSTEDPFDGHPTPPPYTYAPTQIPYTPYPSYYSSPPPPPKRWAWFLFGAGSMLGLGLVVAVFGAIAFFLIEGDVGDGEYFVDQSSVSDAVDKPCADMQDAADDIVFVGGADQAATSMAAFIASLRAVVEAVDGAGPNQDARAWRDDLDALATSLETYAARSPADNAEPYVMPRDGGDPISDRMYVGSPVGCEVPVRIDTLDPDVAAEYS